MAVAARGTRGSCDGRLGAPAWEASRQGLSGFLCDIAPGVARVRMNAARLFASSLVRPERLVSVVAIVLGLALVSGCRADTTSSDGGGSGATVSCDAGATCAAAKVLGPISGDSDAGVVTARGTRAGWVTVRVTEDDDAWTGNAMHVRARLRSPSPGAFTLRAYLDDTKNGDAGLACTRSRGTRAPLADGENLDLVWGDPEDASANGVDDGRIVAFEIRSVSGVCSDDASWELEVRTAP